MVNSNATAEIALAVLGGTELAAQTPKLARTGVAMVRGQAVRAEVVAASTQKAATVERAVLRTETALAEQTTAGLEGLSLKRSMGKEISVGHYLEDFQPSARPYQLVKEQSGMGFDTAGWIMCWRGM